MLAAAAATAPGFDLEAATRAYLDTLQGAARAKSDAYFEGGYWLLLWNALVGIVSAWVLLRLGWSAAWRRLGRSGSRSGAGSQADALRSALDDRHRR